MQCWYYHSVWSYSIFVGDWLPFNPRFFELFAVVWLSLVSFSDSSVGKESAYNAGDPSLIPGSGRPAGEGIGYPLQYSWAFLEPQLVKNLSATWETWVQSLGWEDSLEKGKATHFSILAWRIPCTVKCMGSQRVRHDWAPFTFLTYIINCKRCSVSCLCFNCRISIKICEWKWLGTSGP